LKRGGFKGRRRVIRLSGKRAMKSVDDRERVPGKEPPFIVVRSLPQRRQLEGSLKGKKRRRGRYRCRKRLLLTKKSTKGIWDPRSSRIFRFGDCPKSAKKPKIKKASGKKIRRRKLKGCHLERSSRGNYKNVRCGFRTTASGDRE